MTSSLTFSVIIPAYNAEKTLETALNSILDQTYPVNEIIVVNNNSTDKTTEIAKKFGDKLILVNCYDQGVSNARNLGVSLSTSNYIAFLDADDTWHPEKLSKQIRAIQKNTKELCVYGTYADFFVGKKKVGHSIRSIDDVSAKKNFIESGHLPCILSTWIINRHQFLQTGGFVSDYDTAEDFEFLCRLVASGFNFSITREPLVKYAISQGSISHKNYFRQNLLAKYFNQSYFGVQTYVSSHEYIASVKLLSPTWLDVQANRCIRIAMIHYGRRRFMRSILMTFLAFLVGPRIAFGKARRQLKIK
jgi:glycosyltransferase involved in cell wall biosynthesis